MISEADIQQIKDDLINAGIEYSPLQQELIDHICSGIEIDMEKGGSFQSVYSTIKSSYIDGTNFSELQDDTKNLLDYKSSFLLKLLIGISVITFLGLLFKNFKISGGNIIQFVSFILLSFLLFKLGIYFFKDKRNPVRKKVISFSFFTISIALVLTYLIYCFKPNLQPIATSLNMFSYLLLALTLTIYFSFETEINIYGANAKTRRIDLLVSFLNLVFAITSLVFFQFNFYIGLKYMLFIIIVTNLIILVYHLLKKIRFRNRLTSLLIISSITIHIYHLLNIVN